MRTYYIKPNAGFDGWIEQQARHNRHWRSVKATLLSKLQGNPSNGRLIPGTCDGRQAVIYPPTMIPGYPQIEMVYRIQGEWIEIIGWRSI